MKLVKVYSISQEEIAVSHCATTVQMAELKYENPFTKPLIQELEWQNNYTISNLPIRKLVNGKEEIFIAMEPRLEELFTAPMRAELERVNRIADNYINLNAEARAELDKRERDRLTFLRLPWYKRAFYSIFHKKTLYFNR